MSIEELVGVLLQSDGSLGIHRVIHEASVHLPRRGRLWVASYRDDTGQQRWQSTGLPDRRPALIVAQEWEKAARQRRADQPELPGQPVVRLPHGRGRGGPGLTQREGSRSQRSEVTDLSPKGSRFDRG